MSDARGVHGVGAVVLAGLWIGLSEFSRNQLLLAPAWQSHYDSLGLPFPSAPINAAVWMVWSFVFASALFWISRRFSLLQTTALGWVVGFLMMWARGLESQRPAARDAAVCSATELPGILGSVLHLREGGAPAGFLKDV